MYIFMVKIIDITPKDIIFIKIITEEIMQRAPPPLSRSEQKRLGLYR